MDKLAVGQLVKKATVILEFEDDKKLEFECQDAFVTYTAHHGVALAYEPGRLNPVAVVHTGDVTFDLHLSYVDKESRKEYREAEDKYSQLVYQK